MLKKHLQSLHPDTKAQSLSLPFDGRGNSQNDKIGLTTLLFCTQRQVLLEVGTPRRHFYRIPEASLLQS